MNYSLVEVVLQYLPEPPLAMVFAPANVAVSEVVGSIRNVRVCVGKRGFVPSCVECSTFIFSLIVYPSLKY